MPVERTAPRCSVLALLVELAACGASSGPRVAAGGGGGSPPAGSGGASAGGGSGGIPSTGSGGSAGTHDGGGAAGAATSTGGAPATGGAAATGGAPATGGAAGHTNVGGAGGGAGQSGGGHSGSSGGAGGAKATTCNTTGAATSNTPTVYVIGDSTASFYTSDLYPRMGWAQPLQDYFTPACATIQDKALSGRSSKSFYDEGHWTPIRNGLRSGDFVLIQFGHNDEKMNDPTLYTDPFTTYQQYLSIYVDDTAAKNATPILLTSINRNQWSGTTLSDTHGDYPVAMRQLAATKHVDLVDATALTKAYFERIGQTATTALFMDLAPGQFPNYPNGNTDNTHLQDKGARVIAQLVLADMYRQMFPVAFLLKAIPQAP